MDTRRRMTRSVVKLNGMPVTFRNSTQKKVSLSTTKVELIAAVIAMQDAQFTKNIVKSLGMNIKLLMLAAIDKGGAVDNNTSCGSEIEIFPEIKTPVIIETKWVTTVNNEANKFFKKIMAGPEKNNHAARL